MDRWTEEEQMEETVAVAHLDSNSSLEVPVEVAGSQELGNKWSCFTLITKSWVLQVHTCDRMMLVW